MSTLSLHPVSTVNPARYSISEQKKFLPIIDSRISQIENNLKMITSRLDSMRGLKTADQQENSFNSVGMQECFAEEKNQKSLLLNLQNARKRINIYHTYGTCRLTGKLIDKERLKATPHATTTVEAKTNR